MYFFLFNSLIFISILTPKFRLKNTSITVKKILNCLIFLLFVLLITFRPDYIPDTNNYKIIYSNLDEHKNYGFSLMKAFSRYDIEYGFLYIIKIAKILGLNVYAFFCICSFASTYFSYLGIKRMCEICNNNLKCTENFNIGLFLGIYFSYFGIYYQGIAMRCGISMALGLYATACLYDKKYIRTTILLLLSFSFHRMGIICTFITIAYSYLPAFKKRKYYIAVWGMLFIYYITPLSIYCISFSKQFTSSVLSRIGLLSAYQHFLSMESPEKLGTKFFFYLFVGLLLLVRRDFDDFNERKKLLNIYYIGLFTIPFILSVPLANRIFDYIVIYSIIIIYLFAKDVKIKLFFREAVIIGSTICFLWLSWSVILISDRVG